MSVWLWVAIIMLLPMMADSVQNCFTLNMANIAYQIYSMFLPVNNILIMDIKKDYSFAEINRLFLNKFTVTSGNSSYLSFLSNEEIITDSSILDTLAVIGKSANVEDILAFASNLNLFERFYWLFEKDDFLIELLRLEFLVSFGHLLLGRSLGIDQVLDKLLSSTVPFFVGCLAAPCASEFFDLR